LHQYLRDAKRSRSSASSNAAVLSMFFGEKRPPAPKVTSSKDCRGWAS
jgi:hypothetical protein